MMENIGITATAIAQVPIVFLAVAPSIEHVLKVQNESEAAVVRYGRDMAAAISVGIGAILAVVARDVSVLLFTMVTVAIMFYVYERMTTLQMGTTNG